MTNWMDVHDAKEHFNEVLDEGYKPFVYGGVEYMPSEILKEVDPIVYYQGLQDHCNYLAQEDKIFVKGYTDPEDFEDAE